MEETARTKVKGRRSHSPSIRGDRFEVKDLHHHRSTTVDSSNGLGGKAELSLLKDGHSHHFESLTFTMRTPFTYGKRIKIYRDGDPYHSGIIVVLNTRQPHNVSTLLDAINERIGLALGARFLYTLHGSLIKSTEDLENGRKYVAASGHFTRIEYGGMESYGMKERGVDSAVRGIRKVIIPLCRE